MTAYARTKRMQVVLAGRVGASAASDASSAHPGWVDTPGIADSLPPFKKLTRPILRTPEQGADTFVWLVAARSRCRPPAASGTTARPRPEHYTRRSRASPQRTAATLWDAVEARCSGASA